MLSRALQKANTAVQLDNAQNFEGARHSYAEACELLHQVLARTSTEEDRRKLEAITKRRTYTSRIEELDQMVPVQQVIEGKALPARPESLGLRLNPTLQFDDDDEELEDTDGLETATLTRILKEGNQQANIYSGSGLTISRTQGLGDRQRSASARLPEQYPLQSSFSRSPLRERASDDQLIFQIPTDDAYMPPPLYPRRLSSPKADSQSSPDGPIRSDFSLSARRTSQSSRHVRDSSRESNSWLDPIDESGGSTASSVHSRSSSAVIRRKHIRAPSGATEAEFDAALDAAVEAAYDDGYEPTGFSDPETQGSDDPIVAKALRKVELAKERVRQTEREAIEQANERERLARIQVEQQSDEGVVREDFFDDGSSDEEERILDEITRDYSVDDFAFNLASHQAAARTSGSSDLAQSSWQPSVTPTDAAGDDVFSSLVDPIAANNFPSVGGPAVPPPAQALPELPSKKPVSGATPLPGPGQSVRSRRMSGQNPKQLKIETTKLAKYGDPGRRYSVAQALSGIHGVDFGHPEINGPPDADADADADGSMARPYSPPEGISPTQPTLAHPRGGYLSNKLFVPRDVWKVKGVKIRNVEDKVATCDYLTAALLKLARVDTCDADAVLEEMQALEGILEQVQVGLTRKLGTDVGVQTSSMLFRDASNSAELEAAISVPRSASVSGKSSSFSWRRLRSKNSAAGLNNSFNAKSNGGESGKESPGLETLPMTEHPTSRPSRRDPSNAQFSGPNANYMGSLARLFDAAQTIDQIARQVEDPGLRHADKTQVGLELCTRHAAEFFGFFICRFVLSDLSLLLDKFIKRGSEWVLA
ncbi:Translation factor guf1 mitochondrial [Colletotrichum sp. CLE4]